TPEISLLQQAISPPSALQTRLSAAVLTAARSWTCRLAPALRDGTSWQDEPESDALSRFLETHPQVSYSSGPPSQARPIIASQIALPATAGTVDLLEA